MSLNLQCRFCPLDPLSLCWDTNTHSDLKQYQDCKMQTGWWGKKSRHGPGTVSNPGISGHQGYFLQDFFGDLSWTSLASTFCSLFSYFDTTAFHYYNVAINWIFSFVSLFHPWLAYPTRQRTKSLNWISSCTCGFLGCRSEAGYWWGSHWQWNLSLHFAYCWALVSR